MTLSDVPAGWYPDPADDGVSERYWDGRLWSDQTRQRTSAEATADASADEEEPIPAGWYPDPDTGGATFRYWDGDDWTERTRATLRPTPGLSAGRRSTTATHDRSHDRREPVDGGGPAAESLTSDVTTVEVPAVEAAQTSQHAQGDHPQTEASSQQLSRESDADEIPAGWYPDPDDGGVSARYWNGQDWTERTRSFLRPSPSPTPPAAAKPADEPAPPAVALSPAAPVAEPEPVSPSGQEEPAATAQSEAEDAGQFSTAADATAPAGAAGPHEAAAQAQQQADVPQADVPQAELVAEPVVEEQEENAEHADLAEQADVAEPEVAEQQETAEQAGTTRHTDVPEPAQVAEDAGTDETPADETPAAASADAEQDDAASSADPQPVGSSETAREDGAADERSNGHPAEPRTADRVVQVPSSAPKPGPGSSDAPGPAAVPTSGGQRDGFRPLQRLKGLRRKEEPGERSAATQWAVDTEAVDAFRQLEYNRLELLLGAVWENAMKGDVSSVQAATRLIEIRCRLMGVEVGSSPPEPASPMLVGREERAGERH